MEKRMIEKLVIWPDNCIDRYVERVRFMIERYR